MHRRCLDCGRQIQHREGARCPACTAQRRPSGLWQTLRAAALRRDQFRCVACGATTGLEVHHRQPLARGGQNVLANLVTLCTTCHQSWHRHLNR